MSTRFQARGLANEMVPWFAGAISRGTGPETALEGRSRALQLVQRVRPSKSLLLWMQDVRRMLLMFIGYGQLCSKRSCCFIQHACWKVIV